MANLDTRAPFYAAAVLAALNLGLGLVVLPETVTDKTRRPFTRARGNPIGALRAVARLPGMRRPLMTFLLLAVAMNVYPSVWAFFGKARFGWDTSMIGYSLSTASVLPWARR